MVSCTSRPYESQQQPLLLSLRLAVFQSEVAGYMKSWGEDVMKQLPASAVAVESEAAAAAAFWLVVEVVDTLHSDLDSWGRGDGEQLGVDDQVQP